VGPESSRCPFLDYLSPSTKTLASLNAETKKGKIEKKRKQE
jgi:hypothetical protein